MNDFCKSFVLIFIIFTFRVADCLSPSQIQNSLQYKFLKHLLSHEILPSDITIIRDCSSQDTVIYEDLLNSLWKDGLVIKITCTSNNVQATRVQMNLNYIMPQLFVIEVSSLEGLNNFMNYCRDILNTSGIMHAKFLFINNVSSGSPTILEQPQLLNVPNKMEMTNSVVSESKEDILLLWGHCSFCPEFTKFGRTRMGYVLIGKYEPSQGYTFRNPIFPDFSFNFFETPIKIVQQLPREMPTITCEHLSSWYLKSENNLYLPLIRTVFEKIHFKIHKLVHFMHAVQLGDSGVTVNDLQNIQKVLENSTMLTVSTVLLRNDISDQYVQSSVPFMEASVVMIHRKIQYDLSSVMKPFLVSWRWPTLAAFVFLAAFVIAMIRRCESISTGRKHVHNKLTLRHQIKANVWNLMETFLQQGEFPKISTNGGFAFAASLVLITWGFCGIVYVWMWKLNILESFIGGESAVKIDSIADIIRVNDMDGDIKFKIVTYVSPKMWHEQILQSSEKISGLPHSKYLQLKEITVFASIDTECIDKVLQSQREYFVCIGFGLDMVKIKNLKRYKDKMELLVQVPAELNVQYQSLAFSKDFPWIERIDRRLMSVMETGLFTKWLRLTLNEPIKSSDWKRNLIREFNVAVDFSVINMIVGTLKWYILITVVIFLIEVITTTVPKTWNWIRSLRVCKK